jgi:hypothetical protein
MSEATNQEIFRAIGGLTVAVEGLRRDVEKFDRRNEDAQERADKHRAVIHQEVASLAGRMEAVETGLYAAQETIAETKAVTDDVIQLRQQAMGAGKLGHWLIKLGYWVLAFAGWLVAAYAGLFGKPPPW